MAKLLATLKAIITRLVFAAHGFIAIWQVTNFKRNPLYWYLSSPILLLFFEGIFTLTIKANQEWKWFCPSVFLYLSSVVPAIWLLELDKVDRKLKMRESNMNLTDNLNLTNLGGADLKTLEKALGVNIRLPDIQISTETWVTLIEQFLMLILIIGRWMLPKGELTRDQLSQLLLVYIGTAADIIEFFDSFKENKIAQEPVLVYLTLAIWAWSLMQFTVVLTATKSRKSRLSSGTTTARKRREIRSSETTCCSIDVWGIALNMALQDGPFLSFRLILIVHYRIVSYMNIFFTCKNTLVILLQLYRLYVVQSEGKLKRKKRTNVNGREMTSVSVICNSHGSAPARKRKYDNDEPEGRRTKEGRKNKLRAEDEDSDSEESVEDLEKSPKRRHGKSGAKTKRMRQDTGYSTSSSRNSSRPEKARKREDKRRVGKRDSSPEERRVRVSVDGETKKSQRSEKRIARNDTVSEDSESHEEKGKSSRKYSHAGKVETSTKSTGERKDKRHRRDDPVSRKEAEPADTDSEIEAEEHLDDDQDDGDEEVAKSRYSAESDSEAARRHRRRKRRDTRD